MVYRERHAVLTRQNSLDVAITGLAHARVAARIPDTCVVVSPGEDDRVLRPRVIVNRYHQPRPEPHEPSIDVGWYTGAEAKPGDMDTW